jgi:16S rRNA (uracil1498-N3)-methyltransferase
MPVVNEMMPFERFVRTPREGAKFIAHCYEEIERNDLFNTLMAMEDDNPQVTILVGPEGDFSVDEVRLAMDNGYVPVSLGECRLRTETAALSAVKMAQLTLRKQ